MADTETQRKLILIYMKERGSITSKEAKRLCGCRRLNQRIKEMREMGIRIKAETSFYKSTTGYKVRYYTYRLEDA